METGITVSESEQGDIKRRVMKHIQTIHSDTKHVIEITEKGRIHILYALRCVLPSPGDVFAGTSTCLLEQLAALEGWEAKRDAQA